jgi:hypothetical protein
MVNQDNFQEGAILLSRSLLHSEVFLHKPPMMLKLWIYYLLKASFLDNNLAKYSEFYTNYSRIVDDFQGSITKYQIDNYNRFFRSCQMCTTRKTTRGLYISINNYGLYQDLENYKKRQKKRNKNETKTTLYNNNANNAKNEFSSGKAGNGQGLAVEPAGPNANASSLEGIGVSEPKNLPPADVVFNWPEYLAGMRAGNNRGVAIIGLWCSKRGIVAENKQQAESIIKRNIRTAGGLVGYADSDIIATIDGLASKFSGFGLEAVARNIDNYKANQAGLGGAKGRGQSVQGNFGPSLQGTRTESGYYMPTEAEKERVFQLMNRGRGERQG